MAGIKYLYTHIRINTGTVEKNTEVAAMAELNETKLTDEILGINNGGGEAGSNALPSGSGPVPSGDPRK